MEIPKNRNKTPEDMSAEFERQRELYRRGANYKNLRKQRAENAQAQPVVPAKPETIAREERRQAGIEDSPKTRELSDFDVESFEESYARCGLAARFGALPQTPGDR